MSSSSPSPSSSAVSPRVCPAHIKARWSPPSAPPRSIRSCCSIASPPSGDRSSVASQACWRSGTRSRNSCCATGTARRRSGTSLRHRLSRRSPRAPSRRRSSTRDAPMSATRTCSCCRDRIFAAASSPWASSPASGSSVSSEPLTDEGGGANSGVIPTSGSACWRMRGAYRGSCGRGARMEGNRCSSSRARPSRRTSPPGRCWSRRGLPGSIRRAFRWGTSAKPASRRRAG